MRLSVLPITAFSSALLALMVASAPVAASSFAGSSAGSAAGASSGGTSATSNSTSDNDKQVLAAREDAAAFVASDGRIRSARLEAALRLLRQRPDMDARADDLALARMILALGTSD